MPAPDIPVTVIGGYLGSGKTTLVNHLLRTGGERMAILVNDFGEIDIDADLIEQDDGDTIALANGCICCSLIDGLSSALDQITAMDPRPERVVIEASGVADPGTVAAYGHGPGLTLDAVVVMVDAETIRQRAVDKYVGDTVLGQLRAADVAVVNKIDLVDRAELDEVKDWIRGRVDGAVVAEASQAEVDPAILFGRVDPVSRPAEDPPIHDHAGQVFTTWTWVGLRPVTTEMVSELMEELPSTVVRVKGILSVDDGDGAVASVLQRVGARWSLRPARASSPAAAEPEGRSRLVVIGIDDAIDGAWLGRRLDR